MCYRYGMLTRLLLIGLIAATVVLKLSGQTPEKKVPDDDPQSPGAQLFRTYCASCHGPSGRGDGPVAEAFRQPIADLTQYTARNHGVFPSERVRQIIDGRGIAAHGDREMPVWGDAFRSEHGGLTTEEVKARIGAIVRYLEAIQQRTV